MSQQERDLYTLRSAGFAIIPDFVTQEEADTLLRLGHAFEKEVAEFDERGGNVAYKSGWPLKNVRALYAVEPEFGEFALDPRLQFYVQGYLGRGKLMDSQLLTNMPDPRNRGRDPKGPVNFHRDSRWPDEFEIRPIYLHCFLLLTDMTRENGGTLIVPGSHREREPGHYFKETEPGVKIEENWYPVYEQRFFPATVQVEAPRYSLVLIDPMAVHAQGINVSDERRTVLNTTFVWEEWSGLLNCAGIARNYSRYQVKPELLELLVDDPGLPGTYGPLRETSAPGD
jgi:phytanoyl-CoA dioxygenase PhyH